jgi:hypothetical protein
MSVPGDELVSSISQSAKLRVTTSQENVMRVVKSFVSAHTLNVREAQAEHFLMSFAYGCGALLVHSPVGSTIIGICYLTVATLGIKANRSK